MNSMIIQKKGKKMPESVDSIDNLEAVGVRVVVKTERMDDKTKGGIALTSEYLKKEQDRMTEGVLIKYGPVAFLDLVSDEIQIPALGSKVYFVKYAGRAIQVGDDEYRILNDEDIFAVMNPEDKEV